MAIEMVWRRRAAAFLAAAGMVAAAPARADYYVSGGADSAVAPTLSAEFQVVYAGQHFTAATVDSLGAQEGFLSNDCTFDELPNCGWSPLGAGTPIDLGVSLIPLTQAQVTSYNAGLGATNGPIVQYPLYGVAVALVTAEAGITQNGQVIIDDGALCGIMSGQLTDWSQFGNSAPPGGFSVVYDASTGSGLTWLLTQHLHAACNATNSAFTTLPVPVTGNFASLPVPGGVAKNPRFVAATGTAAMQAALLASGSAIGYLAPSFTSVAPASPVASSLVVAALVNAQNHVPYTPTISYTANGLRNAGPGAVNTTAPATRNAAANAANWVPQNPMPASGYPIVGWASWIVSTCYATVGRIFLQYLTQPYNPTMHAAIVANAGFATLTSTNGVFAKAVQADLLKNTSNYGINIENALTCLAYTGR